MKRFLLTGMLVLSAWIYTNPVLAEKNTAEMADERIGSAIRFYVAEQLSVDASEIEVEALTAMNAQKRIQSGKVLKIRAANRKRFLGRAVFVVSVRGAAGNFFNQWVSADVSQRVHVVVAGRKLRRLHVIEAADVHLQAIRLRHTRRRYLLDPEVVVGKRLTQSLRKGTPIREDQLEIAPLVRRGDRVTITVRSEGLQIVTTGKAKQDGQLGEMIRVMNLDSKKTVFAEVVTSGDVRIVLRKEE